SRRRHTRSKRDWSSDVCSSDLGEQKQAATGTTTDTQQPDQQQTAPGAADTEQSAPQREASAPSAGKRSPQRRQTPAGSGLTPVEIGRASCRESADVSLGCGRGR